MRVFDDTIIDGVSCNNRISKFILAIWYSAIIMLNSDGDTVTLHIQIEHNLEVVAVNRPC